MRYHCMQTRVWESIVVHRHVRMQRKARNAVGLEAPRELVRKEHIREFRLRVHLERRVGARPLVIEVVNVETGGAAVRARRDGDDARAATRALEHAEQQRGEQKVPKVIRAHLHFKTGARKTDRQVARAVTSKSGMIVNNRQ
jgi:hypothetical protein